MLADLADNEWPALSSPELRAAVPYYRRAAIARTTFDRAPDRQARDSVRPPPAACDEIVRPCLGFADDGVVNETPQFRAASARPRVWCIYYCWNPRAVRYHK